MLRDSLAVGDRRVLSSCKMALVPVARQPCYLIQGSRLLEQVCRSRNDYEPLFASERRERCPVQLNHLDIVSADDEQSRRLNKRQDRSCQIGPPTTRHNCPHPSERSVAATKAAAAPVLAPK